MMSEVVRDANVYFLPAAPPVLEAPRAPSLWRRLRARFKNDLWRVRFAVAGVRLALRAPRTALFADEDTLAPFSEQRAELIERRPRISPARVIDFGSARARLRPVAAAR
jgi:hypothetical protein